jgi:dephospho-CoA kinase
VPDVLRVGLTGGIACGKSAVGQMLVAEGAYVLEADKLSHQLMLPGKPVYGEIIQRFGREILKSDGEIDRAALAQIVFNDHTRLQELTSILHPAVIRAQEQWMDDMRQSAPTGIVVVEAALIYEANLATHFDKIIVVTCTPEDKLQRLARRMGIDDLEAARLELERRSSAQIPDDEKAQRADYLIENSGTLRHTQDQVRRVMIELRHLAAGTTARSSPE